MIPLMCVFGHFYFLHHGIDSGGRGAFSKKEFRGRVGQMRHQKLYRKSVVYESSIALEKFKPRCLSRTCSGCSLLQNIASDVSIERLGESGATHDSQSASRSGVEAWVARNLNGWDDSDAGLSQG